ncbi:putative pentatricopeptide repeat-containing protein At3g15130 [Dioscorea cayenensis subsp. rotundata]|uniref:Pentatricopeptide repeat-containing protein At3g15130 n=1 Tax=Dioscorea cayennensis subsp. rotundata TaxID=55577 RepID=A0AB40BIH9_DIOCR|nr:putative pentatricopeptide repeat-containing protein At3g15130 [Dioscorea cayenensis subsp. rotundata]
MRHLRRLRAPPTLSDHADAEHHYSQILQRCAHTSNLLLGSSIHAHILKLPLLTSSLFLQNHLLNMYFKSSPSPSLPLQLFDEMPHRNIVSWSASIAGLVQLHYPDHALLLFAQMRRAGIIPNEFTLVSTLNASSLTDNAAQSYRIYAHVIKLGFQSNLFLLNAFLTALIRSGRFDEAVELFEKSNEKDVVSWNSIISGFLQVESSELWAFWCRMNQEEVIPDEFSFSSILAGLAKVSIFMAGIQVHGQLVKSGFGDDVCVGNALADMYLKNQALVDALKVFDEMPQRDVVSWTEMASGCLLSGQPSKALDLIRRMKSAGIMPNKFTLATMFNACANLSSLEEGKKGHGFRIKLGVNVDECVDNALVDMYAKCGSMDCAWRAFQLMRDRSVISWTTMIMGFALNGLACEALKAFDEMILERVRPNHITLTCVLYACCQGGYIDEGLKYFEAMECEHCIAPGEDHYVCIVDLLSRAGRIAEAEAFIRSAPFKPSVRVWQTLLGACRVYGDIDTGERAAKAALALDKNDPSTYLLLSNMFANSSNWDGVSRVRELMENWQVKKIPGWSWIEVAKDDNHRLKVI